jgi:hypothetical protein
MDEQLFGTDKPLQNREWNLVDNSVELKDFDKKEMFQGIVITMEIQRRSSTHVSAVLLVAFGINNPESLRISIDIFLTFFYRDRCYNSHKLLVESFFQRKAPCNFGCILFEHNVLESSVHHNSN